MSKSKAPTLLPETHPCPHPGCGRSFYNDRAMKGHMARAHGGAAAFAAPGVDAPRAAVKRADDSDLGALLRAEVERLSEALDNVERQRDAARAELATATETAARDYSAAERAERRAVEAEAREAGLRAEYVDARAELKTMTADVRAIQARLDGAGVGDPGLPVLGRVEALIAALAAERAAHHTSVDEHTYARGVLTRERDEARAALAKGDAGEALRQLAADGSRPDLALRLATITAERDEARAALSRIGDAWAELTAHTGPVAPRQRPARAPATGGSPEGPGAPAEGTDGAVKPRRLQRCVACGECRNPRRRMRCEPCEAANTPALSTEQWAELTEQARRRGAA